MTRSAKEVVEHFWQTQNDGDYNQLVPLFAQDAVLEDPFYGRFEGKEAIAGFMSKMVTEMAAQQVRFRVERISGGGGTAWAQWVAQTPAGDVPGCGVYEVRGGLLTYYRDYMMSAADSDG